MQKMFLLFAAALLLAGCNFNSESAVVSGELDETDAFVTIVKVKSPILLDGKLDDLAWQKAPAVEMCMFDTVTNQPPRQRKLLSLDKFDKARVKLLYDDKYLYVGAVLEDDDIMSYAGGDQQMIFSKGDTFELFLKHENVLNYWEFHAAPNGYKACLEFLSRAMPVSNDFIDNSGMMPGFDVASQFNGSFNEHSNTDNFWSTEMRIPLAELEKRGKKFVPGEPWRVLFARYNYSSKKSGLQYSTFPALPVLSFHTHGYYALLKFE